MGSLLPGSLRTLAKKTPGTALVALFGVSLVGVAWLSVLSRERHERAEEIRRVYEGADGLARAFEEHVRRVVRTADNALLFVALRALGREVEFGLYPEEHHEMKSCGRPDRRIDRMERILGWFDRWVRESPA